MNHQPVFSWLPLVFVVACGGGGGPALDVQDGTPDQTPPNSDQVVIADPPPSNEQPPPPPPGTSSGSTGGGDTGGSCGSACADSVTRGCQTSQSDCVDYCNASVEVCERELRELVVCALGIYCPEDLEDLNASEIQTLQTICFSQTSAYASCQNANDEL